MKRIGATLCLLFIVVPVAAVAWGLGFLWSAAKMGFDGGCGGFEEFSDFVERDMK